MKSLFTRFASIGVLFSLVLAGSSVTTPAQTVDPSFVHIHRGAVGALVPGANNVLAKVTALCTGGTGTVTVTITQTMAQSNANTNANGTGTSSVKCDGQLRTVAVSVGAFTANIGEATGVVMLSAPSGPATQTRTIVLGFPVIEHMEEEDGGNS